MSAARYASIGAAALCSLSAAVSLRRVGDDGTSPMPPPSQVEEVRRYPCLAFDGMDIVVKNYYVPAASAAPPKPGAFARFLEFLKSGNTAALSALPVGDDGDDQNELRRVRRVVRAGDNAGTQPTPLCSSGLWPPGTQKYSALVMDSRSSSSAVRGSTPFLDGGFGELLQLAADSATDQSLVRCNPTSPAVGLNCSNTGATLEVPYLRTMLTALAWLPLRSPSPLHVGVLGVGGGALPAFLQHYCGHMLETLDLVDVEPMCFTAALDDMGLAEALGPSLTTPAEAAVTGRRDGVFLFAMDAQRFLLECLRSASGKLMREDPTQRTGLPSPPFDERVHTSLCAQEGRQRFDLLFVDLFCGSTLSPILSSRAFLQLCHESLSTPGVVAFNLPQADRAFLRTCEGVFGSSHSFAISVPHSANCIVVACKSGTENCSRRFIWKRAEETTRMFRLPFSLQLQLPLSWMVR